MIIMKRKLVRESVLPYDFIAFKECNNKCTFCFQKNTRNTAYTSQEDVLKRFDLILEDARQNYHGHTEIQIDITGGELFFRKDLFEMYKTMFDRINKLQQDINVPIRCLLGTNLLYKDTTLLYRVLDYIMNLNQNLLRGVFTSFDFCGRFKSIKHVELHHKNILQLLEYTRKHNIYLACVTVLTKQAIRLFNNPKTELDVRIKQLYDEYYHLSQQHLDRKNNQWWFRLSWTLLSPNSLDPEYIDEMVPTSDDIAEFYKQLVDNYNDLAVVRAFYDKNILRTRCSGHCKVCKTYKIESACQSNIYGDELRQPENLYVPSNSPLDIYNFLIKRFGCYSCKYFTHCYIRPCAVVSNLKIVERGDKCWRKEIYEYIENSNNKISERQSNC